MSHKSSHESFGVRVARYGWFLLPLMLVTGGLFASWWYGRAPEESRVVGQPMPLLNLEFVQGAKVFGGDKGERVVIAKPPGRLLIVNFWASWCDSCRQEAPEMDSFWRAHRGEGIAMVGIAFNDEPMKVRAAIRELHKTYPIALDAENRAAVDFGITGVPETFFIGSDGKVLHKEIGPVDRDLLESLRSSLLGGS